MQESTESQSRWGRPGVLFGILFGINVVNYTDRFILPAVASSIKSDLVLTDTQVGLLGTAFLLVYAIVAIPAGSIADRYRRTTLVSAGVALWSVATLFTGLTRTFPQIFAARALLGIGESTYFPPSTTLLADSFLQRDRARVMSWWGMATPIGVFLGFGLGGFIGAQLGWRAAFFLTAVPGLILALLVRFVRDPPRGATEALSARDDGTGLGRVLAQLLTVRTLTASILSQALSFFVLGGVTFWVPSYMSTYFQQDASRAGLLAGSVIVVGGGIGTIAGGYLADALLARGIASARLLVPSIGFLAAAPFVLLALLTGSLPTFLAMMLVASGLLQSANGPLTALSQDVITPARRARAVAISLLLTHLLGDAFAPVAIGSLSDARGGLQQALLLTPITLVAAALIGFIGCRFVDRDRVKVVDEARLTV